MVLIRRLEFVIVVVIIIAVFPNFRLSLHGRMSIEMESSRWTKCVPINNKPQNPTFARGNRKFERLPFSVGFLFDFVRRRRLRRFSLSYGLRMLRKYVA